MKYTYTEILDEDGNLKCVNRSDGWLIPIDPANSDYQRYLRWVENPNAEEANYLTPPAILEPTQDAQVEHLTSPLTDPTV